MSLDRRKVVREGVIAGIAGLFGALLSYVVLWAGVQSRQIQMETQLTYIAEQVQDCKNDHYTADDARRDFLLINHQISENAAQIKMLRELVDKHVSATTEHRVP